MSLQSQAPVFGHPHVEDFLRTRRQSAMSDFTDNRISALQDIGRNVDVQRFQLGRNLVTNPASLREST